MTKRPMIGKTISHYKILEKLGEGDMGGVCMAVKYLYVKHSRY